MGQCDIVYAKHRKTERERESDRETERERERERYTHRQRYFKVKYMSIMYAN